MRPTHVLSHRQASCQTAAQPKSVAVAEDSTVFVVEIGVVEAIRSNQKVLDVAAGNGNVSLAAARRWCNVVATDYVPALLERARVRAASTPRAPAQQKPANFEATRA